jgi:myo-inositol-1(or 4)-monophosphatase
VGQTTYKKELEVAIAAARTSGATVRDLYERAVVASYVKKDGSPVTDADLASDQIIREFLGNAFPGDALLTEEGVDDPARLANPRVWIVDPIDGTEQFVKRSGEFDVLIALVDHGAPVVSVMLQPTTGQFVAASAGGGAWIGEGTERKSLRFDAADPNLPPRVATSKWFSRPVMRPALLAMCDQLGIPEPEVSPIGVALRPYLPPANRIQALVGLPDSAEDTMGWEWDFVAADLIVHEAGGAFTDAWGNRLVYNKPIPRNLGGIVLSVDPATHDRLLDAIQPGLSAS